MFMVLNLVKKLTSPKERINELTLSEISPERRQ